MSRPTSAVTSVKVPLPLLRKRREGGAGAAADATILDAEEVGPAVVVVVDPGEAAAHRLRDQVKRCLGVEVLEVDATLVRDIDEPGRLVRSGGWGLLGKRLSRRKDERPESERP
jgi:hypothetical protein